MQISHGSHGIDLAVLMAGVVTANVDWMVASSHSRRPVGRPKDAVSRLCDFSQFIGRKPMPPVTTLENADSRAFWDGVKAGRLVFQKCKTCGAVQFPPRYHCAACWASELENIDSSGRGSVESFTIVRRAPTAAYR